MIKNAFRWIGGIGFTLAMVIVINAIYAAWLASHSTPSTNSSLAHGLAGQLKPVCITNQKELILCEDIPHCIDSLMGIEFSNTNPNVPICVPLRTN